MPQLLPGEISEMKAEDTEACALCLEPMASPFWPWANCTHVVHKECAVRLVKLGTKRECPVCRTRMSKFELSKLKRIAKANPKICRDFQKTSSSYNIWPMEVHPRHLLPLCCNRVAAVDSNGDIEYSSDRRMRFSPLMEDGRVVENRWLCYPCGREVSEKDSFCRDLSWSRSCPRWCDMHGKLLTLIVDVRAGYRWFACMDQSESQQPHFSTCTSIVMPWPARFVDCPMRLPPELSAVLDSPFAQSQTIDDMDAMPTDISQSDVMPADISHSMPAATSSA